MDRRSYSSSRGRPSSHYSQSSRPGSSSYPSSHSRYESSRDYRDSTYSPRGSHHASSSLKSDRYHGSSSNASRYSSEDRYRISSSGYASSSSSSTRIADDRSRESSSYKSRYPEAVYDSRSYDRHPPERSASGYKRPYPPHDDSRSGSFAPRPESRGYRYEERPPRPSPIRVAYEPPLSSARPTFKTPRRIYRGSSLRVRGGMRSSFRPRISTYRTSETIRPRRGVGRGRVIKRAHIIRRQREEALAEAEKAVKEITEEGDEETSVKRRKRNESESSAVQVKEEIKDEVGDKTTEEKTTPVSPTKSSGTVVKVTGTRSGSQTYIKLICPHCSYRCVTFKDYANHLNLSRHVNALHNVTMRMKLYLQKLRERQRRDQAEIDKKEENQNEEDSNFCLPCKLYYKNDKNSHEESKIHKVIVDYLNPRCKTCDIEFRNRLVYERHLASLNHIRRLASNDLTKTAKREKRAVDEDEDINMDKFMTVDAVGNVDEESEAAAKKAAAPVKPAIPKIPGAVGEAYVELVNVYYCRLCERYLARTNPLEKALGIHCKGPTHKSNFRSKQSEAEKVEKKENIAKEPAEPTENAPMPKENPEVSISLPFYHLSSSSPLSYFLNIARPFHSIYWNLGFSYTVSPKLKG
ncbi:uncharacterized protein LOC136029012 [Artemia franciscana]|uniref:uncharacterized protein LOC136029012 n=1 Tax=Artemia franciscana TaxID=6661 RepID=UPI0032DB9943